MHYLIALICLVLSLAGVEGYGSQSHATRATVNGVDVIYSRIRIVADIADITCVRSASGQCHYRLLTCPRPAARGASAGIAYATGSIATGTRSGTIKGTIPLVDNAYGSKLIPAQIQDLRSGLWYLNIHTTTFSGGEIRGQVDPAGARFYRLVTP